MSPYLRMSPNSEPRKTMERLIYRVAGLLDQIEKEQGNVALYATPHHSQQYAHAAHSLDKAIKALASEVWPPNPVGPFKNER